MQLQHLFTATLFTLSALANAAAISARAPAECAANSFCPSESASGLPLAAYNLDAVVDGALCQYGEFLQCFYRIQKQGPGEFEINYLKGHSVSVTQSGDGGYTRRRPEDGECPPPKQVTRNCLLPWGPGAN
ncbi:hypothetical protein FRB99_003118 [Tulasnella sp. 403]|nr:hypothetical protein FRB99_003118 [Tulasnella sp. 403]